MNLYSTFIKISASKFTMPMYPNSYELTSIVQYFLSEVPQEVFFLHKSFNMETNERPIWAGSVLREKPKQGAPVLLAENLHGKLVLFLYQPTYLELF